MNYTHRILAEDITQFRQGRHYTIYEKMGAHLAREKDAEGTYFAVWAPNARNVSVVGSFNDWNPYRDPMKKIGLSGIWELFIPNVREGAMYKYVIENEWGGMTYKADPYGNSSQLRPDSASIICDLTRYEWQDHAWQISHAEKKINVPMAIYEVHPGSWKKDWRHPGGFLDYRTLAHELGDYVKEMGYTHVELIGISEHPFDGSWGYQVSGYYAPTSRHGGPEDFMYFVDHMHRNGIGVILDWVPAHFPKDEFGLGRFDGTPLYEYADPKRGERPDWGTYCFDYTKNEVSNFLIANALFWIEKFHVDGLRVDAVASMLYRDFGRRPGEWEPNEDGTNEDYDAVKFIRHLNTVVRQRDPGALMMAEESSAWPKVTGAPEEGGLGFTYKWNMGWMNDFLKYMQCDPIFRKHEQNKITFSFMYAFNENYIQVLSHDEVVHLKKSMLYKMPGSMQEKFGNLRAAYALTMMHPGKKLLFMGQDFGQPAEWNEAKSLDWHLLERVKEHQQLHAFYKDLLHFYKGHAALYEMDDSPETFQWINGSDSDHNMLTFCRLTRDGKRSLLCHFNFSPVSYESFHSGVLCPGIYREVFNSNAPKYGGNGMVNDKPIEATDKKWDYKDYSIEYKLGAYGVSIFEFDYIPGEKIPVPTEKVMVPEIRETKKKRRIWSREEIRRFAGRYKKIQ